MKYGTQDIIAANYGTTKIVKVYYGIQLVWEPVPEGYIMTIGSGANRGYASSTYGDLEPDIFEGLQITEISVSSFGRMIMRFSGSVQVPGVTTIKTLFENEGVLRTLTWDSTNRYYVLNSQSSLYNWFGNHLGEEQPLTIEL